jgi:hypothetical protein
MKNKGIYTLILAIVVNLISCTESRKVKEDRNVPVGCSCPSILEHDDTQNWFFCGFELNDNCSRYVIYKCRLGNITVRTDCPFEASIDDQIKAAHYCMLSPLTNSQRYCAFIQDCKEELGLCGFPSLKAVKDVIRKNPDKTKRRIHLLHLDKPEKCKEKAL